MFPLGENCSAVISKQRFMSKPGNDKWSLDLNAATSEEYLETEIALSALMLQCRAKACVGLAVPVEQMLE